MELTEEIIRQKIAENGGKGVFFEGVSNEDYHNGPGYSSSNIKAVVNGTIGRFLHEKANPKERTAALKLGTMIHTWLLERSDFDKRYFRPEQAPKAPSRSKKEGKELYAKWEVENFDRLAKDFAGGPLTLEAWQKEYIAWKHPELATMEVVDEDDMAVLVGIEKSFKEHPEIQELFAEEDGKSELSLYWVDPKTDLLCKCRPDRLNFKWPCILDIKSCPDAGLDEFEADITVRDYHISAWWYLWGAKMVFGVDFEQFVYVPCEKTPPYQVAYYPADEGSLAVGEGLSLAGLMLLKDYQDSLTNGKTLWQGHSRGVKAAGIRPWAFNKLSQVIARHDLQGRGLEQYVGV